ncbi:quinone oxidoreductase family protein [Mycolicibacterium stellerae]|uniref:quinone oxidoreductase family protein n=1 Tax=Mycolicibacterium stellerae TaxID=2358193 RepID=UPI000F0B0160|nr:quinone oxidoreductase [Mycolicibacterium stellerae]
MRAVIVTRHGGPEVLEVRDIPEPEPSPGEILVAVGAVGVNYHDSMTRRGVLDSHPPFTIGVEGAGTVVALGGGVEGVMVGQRVAWPLISGSYAELAVIPVSSALPVPDSVTLESAAALIAQGLTADYLTSDAYPVQPGDDVLVHAAAGGVGNLIVQMAKHRGARVLATTSDPAKGEIARAAGADEIIGYDDFATQIDELTAGKGVEVIYDGVGARTFEQDLVAIARRGNILLYGAPSGPIPPFDLRRLSQYGSPYVSRPTLLDYIENRDALLARGKALFDLAANGVISVSIAGRFSLDEAGLAHHMLEDRSRIGKIVIFPGGVPI